MPPPHVILEPTQGPVDVFCLVTLDAEEVLTIKTHLLNTCQVWLQIVLCLKEFFGCFCCYAGGLFASEEKRTADFHTE
jgi:hypothetical protein